MNLSKDKFVLKKINTRTHNTNMRIFRKKNPRQKSILTKLADCNFDVNENINDYHTDIGIRKSRKKQYMNIYIFFKKDMNKTYTHTFVRRRRSRRMLPNKRLRQFIVSFFLLLVLPLLLLLLLFSLRIAVLGCTLAHHNQSMLKSCQ